MTTHRTSARHAGAALTLLLVSSCADDAPTTSETAITKGEHAAALSERSCEVEPEYDLQALTELAQSPEVQSANAPFASAPAPDRVLYVPMSDGVRLSVSLYFPPGLDRAPAIYIESWYGRKNEAGGHAIAKYREAGFVVALIDSRGFAASFGAQPGLLAGAAARDQEEVVNWIASQPWSNGKVAAVGISLSATLADRLTSTGAPALEAAILRHGDFDAYRLNMLPGGVPNLNMQGLIMGLMAGMEDQSCVADLATCASFGIATVDEDVDYRLLQSAFADHLDNVGPEALGQLVFRDDPLGVGTVADMSPAEHLAGINAARVPARVSAGWLDGVTAQGALERFVGAPDVPMEVVISAANHMGGLDTDPFVHEPFGEARPSAAVQSQADVDFVKRVLSGEPVERQVRYFVLGADQWKTTKAWPPASVEQQTLHFTRHGLRAQPGKPGERSYQVDPTTSAGAEFSRWSSQYAEPVYYGDRRAVTGKRLSFDAPTLREDTELVGAPELCLSMRSDQPDGLVIAYLEDVAPDGRVTYLTEGELRLLHRKTATGGCDTRPGTARSFARADASPVTPGELMQVELPLWPVAALLRRGHHLRISLAGADEGTFPLLSDEPARWSVAFGSTLTVPTRPW